MARTESDMIAIISDLKEFDSDHLLLEPHEVAAMRLVKNAGLLCFFMLDPLQRGEDGAIEMAFGSIDKHVVNLYIDTVLINVHLGSDPLATVSSTIGMGDIRKKFGLELVGLVQKVVSTLIEGLHLEDATLYGSASKVLKNLIFSIIRLYSVSNDAFYERVEEGVFDLLGVRASDIMFRGSSILQRSLDGGTDVVVKALLDKRMRNPFKGFHVEVEGSEKTFMGKSPVKAFFELSLFVSKRMDFTQVSIHFEKPTKSILDRYGIKFIREDVLQDHLAEGFLPILLPAGVDDMDGFLDELNK